MDRYTLERQPAHSKAPDAWMVEHEVVVGDDEDGEPVTEVDVVCAGLPLREALEQIQLSEDA